MRSISLISFVPVLFVWLWSTGFVGARFGLPYIEPFYMLTLRFMITIPCFILIIYILKRRWLATSQIRLQLLIGALLHGGYLGGVFYAVSIGTPAGICAIIVGIQPILSTFLNWILFGETVTRHQIIGLSLGFLGLIAVIMGSKEITQSANGYIGLITCALSLLAISMGTILQKRYAGDTPLVAGAMWQYVGAIVVVGFATLFLEQHEIDPQWQLFAAFGWLIIALSIGAILILMYMIREGEVAKVNSYFYLVPPVAALQTWWLFDEALSPISLIGCVVVVLGVALVVKSRA